MDESTRELVQTSAESLKALTDKGLAAISEGNYDVAATIYALVTEVSHSLGTSLRMVSLNALKRELIPEEMLVTHDTGAEKPTVEPGQYL